MDYSPVNHLLVDVLPVLLVFLCSNIRAKTLEGYTGHVHTAPYRNYMRKSKQNVWLTSNLKSKGIQNDLKIQIEKC